MKSKIFPPFDNLNKIFFLDGSLGDAVYCAKYISKISCNDLTVFCTKSIAKEVLSVLHPGLRVYVIPIGAKFFRLLLMFLIIFCKKNLRKNHDIHVFNKKSFRCIFYKINGDFFSREVCALKDIQTKKQENIESQIVLVNRDVDSSIKIGILFNEKSPTKLPSIYFFSRLIAELKAAYPEFKFIQIGSRGDAIPGVDVNLTGKTSIVELVKLIKKSKYIISVEGGVRALAIYFGKKGFSIEGPTSSNMMPCNDNFIDYHPSECPPCWRGNFDHWYVECAMNKEGRALCTSDSLLITKLANIVRVIKNEINS